MSSLKSSFHGHNVSSRMMLFDVSTKKTSKVLSSQRQNLRRLSTKYLIIGLGKTDWGKQLMALTGAWVFQFNASNVTFQVQPFQAYLEMSYSFHRCESRRTSKWSKDSFLNEGFFIIGENRGTECMSSTDQSAFTISAIRIRMQINANDYS